jgi:hypothetical protein
MLTEHSPPTVVMRAGSCSLDDRQRAAQLLKHDGLRFDAVALLEPDIAHFDGHDSGRASVLRQHRLQHLGAN